MNPFRLSALLLGLGVFTIAGGCGGGSTSANSGGQQTSPAPVVSSISPAKVPAGSNALVLTVTGSGFLSNSVVEVNNVAEVTTYVDSTQLTAVVPAGQLASGAQLAVVISNGPGSTGSGSPISLEIDNPAPTVTSVLPTTLPIGSASPIVNVTGTGFVPTTVINVNGSARPTSFISTTQVSATLAAADVATGATLSLTVVNAAPGGGTASPAAVTVVAPNPAPAITSLLPSTVVAGSGPQTVAVTGTGFVPGTVIAVNGSARSSSYVSSTKVSANFTASDVATAGSLSITAVNPLPGGGTSAAFSMSVNNPSVGTLQLSPSTLSLGATSPATITVTGNTFVPTSTVQVNGTSRAATYVNAGTLTFVATVADQATAGTLAVTVTNPPPGGGTSPAANLSVGTSGPVIRSITPNPLYVGSADTSITISGSGLSASTTVQWNGTPLVVDGYSFSAYGALVTAIVPAADLAAPATASVTVNTPEITPSLSNAFNVSIVNPPPPAISSISPVGAPINTASTITVTGSGFTKGSTIDLNGVAVATTYGNSSSLTAQLPASAVATPGVYNLTVNTPAPGGGTSSALSFTAYVSIPNNSMVYNPVNGLFYLSVPSAAGPPYGNCVVPIDPLTGQFGIPIPVGSEPDQLAITSDGTSLWVALDGASAVRKVDLVAGTAGLQFPVVQEQAGFAAAALAALPGAPDSVVVATVAGNINQALAIYDSGVIRGQAIQATIYTYNPWALVVDGTRSEIYAGGSAGTPYPTNYDTYTYDASGLTLKTAGPPNLSYASQNNNEMQIANGRLYTDFGQVDDPESGTVLGTFYSSGTAAAQGSTTVDTTLGLAFVLEGYYGSSQFQLQSFNLSDFTPTASIPIAIYNPTSRAGYQIEGPTGNRLTRWGSDGLAFRTTGGFISLRSSMVQDLSSVNADLGVAIAASGPGTTGNTATYTATISNHGPAAASNVALTGLVPSTGVLSSVTASGGNCSGSSTVVCDLGGLSSGASATVVFNILQVSAGSSTMTVQVNASENDPVPANNQATATLTSTGSAYNLAPVLTAITPAGIASGSSDTQVALTGTNFASGATVLLNGTALVTSFDSSTELTAVVPAASLTKLGWAVLSVSNPVPGGGTSAALPLSVFSVIALGANHILYDPYSRQIMGSVGTGTSSIAGNSIVAIQPETAAVGTPVPIGGTPTNLALSSDGQMLYALLPSATAGSVARFNMLTQQPDFTVSTFQATGYNTGLRDIAAQPGTENTVAVDEGEYQGVSIFDFDPQAKTATRRGTATGIYTGTCVAFPNASTLYSIDLYSSPTALNIYSVTSTGLVNESSYWQNTSIMQNINCYKLSGDLLVTQSGGVSNTSTIPVLQVGVFEGAQGASDYGAGITDFVPDASLGLAYFLTDSNGNNYSAIFDSITAFNTQTFMPASVLKLPFETFEGTGGFTGIDVVRWGQDGLAILSSGGNIYLVRGGAIVPQLLQSDPAASLAASSPASIPHGSGNTLLTLTGANFLPGVAVTWNGSYRTTTVVDSSHMTVAIPASDLANSGTGTVIATNPGATGSNALTINVN
jgi:trimeric autotransporter adhesin